MQSADMLEFSHDALDGRLNDSLLITTWEMQIRWRLIDAPAALFDHDVPD